LSPAHYPGPIRLRSIIDGGRTFVEWHVDLDTLPGQADAWRDLLNSRITQWTDSLRTALARAAASAAVN
jgi:hypothetical protein